MAFDVQETSASGSKPSVQLIDLTEEEQEAPFAVREADGSVHAAPGRIPDRAEILAWLEDHPVVVGIATGVLCFAIIAGAMTTVTGSDSDSATDDPVAGAALSETDGSQGSFSSSGSGGANFTSDDSKLSRTGAGKVADEADGETAAGANTNPMSPTAQNSSAPDEMTAGASNLDQSATVNRGTPSADNGSGQPPGRAPSTTRPAGTGQNANPGPNSNSSPTTAATSAATGSTATTLNPGPNVSGPIPTTATTRVTTSNPANPTTVTTGQTQPTPQPTTPTTATTIPTTAATTPTTAAADLSIVAPGNGTRHLFESPTDFAVNFVAGATQYCWTFIQSGVTALNACSGGTTYQLPARPAGLGPGLVTVRATATGPFGSVEDTIQISLPRSRVMNNPLRDVQIGRGPLRVGVLDLIGATSYCFRITQAGYDSGQLCYGIPGNTFTRNDPIWDLLSPGPLNVTGTVYAGGMVLATDSVSINLLVP